MFSIIPNWEVHSGTTDQEFRGPLKFIVSEDDLETFVRVLRNNGVRRIEMSKPLPKLNQTVS